MLLRNLQQQLEQVETFAPNNGTTSPPNNTTFQQSSSSSLSCDDQQQEGSILLVNVFYCHFSSLILILGISIVIVALVRFHFHYLIRRVVPDCLRRRICPYFSNAAIAQRRRGAGQQQQQQQQSALQLELEEQVRQARRKERIEWYQTYLKPFTKKIEQEDFILEEVGVSDYLGVVTGADGTPDLENHHPAATTASSDTMEYDCSTNHQRRVRLAQPRRLHDGSCTSPEEHPPGLDDANDDTVEGHCIICLIDYQVGDSIVWASVPGCPHAFHDACILSWLSRGKKHCPMCRRWFVPAVRATSINPQDFNTKGPDEQPLSLERGPLDQHSGSVDDDDNDNVEDSHEESIVSDSQQHQSTESSSFDDTAAEESDSAVVPSEESRHH